MSGEIRKGFGVGKFVYQACRDPDTGGDWYMPCHVDRITEKFVFVNVFGYSHTIRLKRRSLERWGSAVSTAHSMAFYAELPEDYRKRTIGYLMDEEPRKVLGLPDGFTTEDQLREAYRRRALETHPDRGGSEEAFRAVNEAYERLGRLFR